MCEQLGVPKNIAVFCSTKFLFTLQQKKDSYLVSIHPQYSQLTIPLRKIERFNRTDLTILGEFNIYLITFKLILDVCQIYLYWQYLLYLNKPTINKINFITNLSIPPSAAARFVWSCSHITYSISCICRRNFADQGRHSQLQPKDTTLLKSQDPLLWLEAAMIACFLRPQLS